MLYEVTRQTFFLITKMFTFRSKVQKMCSRCAFYQSFHEKMFENIISTVKTNKHGFQKTYHN